MLAHVAEAMGVVAAETIAGAETMELDYDLMPRATFCQPQVASFGYTEAQARDEKGYDVKVAQVPVHRQRQGAGPRRAGRLRQARRRREVRRAARRPPDRPRGHRAAARADPGAEVGPHRDELARNVHAHPTLSEALQEAFHGLAGHMINL
jgi:dihydrolipoamide dehydrogenase